MDQEWIGIKGKCDVVVHLVQRLASASTDQGCAVMEEKEARKRKRLFEPGEEDQIVGYLNVHSNHLRRCSEYFDTCLSKEWAGGAGIIKTPVHLSLDVHTDVKYYRECFSRMHSSECERIPNVEHGLKLLQVASQISYFSLVEDCVRYLTSVPWSYEDDRRIREFANSMVYPSDCATDLSARLGLGLGFPSSNAKRHSLLCNATESAICQHFDYAMRLVEPLTALRYNGRKSPIDNQQLFSLLFQKIIAGPYQTVVENVLKHVHACVKKTILEAKEHPGSNDDPEFSNVRWILELLLKTGFATELVEYIAEESPLSEMLKEVCDKWQMSWLKIIYDVFQEVIAGHLLLNTSTRYILLRNWMWILDFGANSAHDDYEGPIPTMLNTFVLTFPLEMQKEIFKFWLTYVRSEGDSYGLNFVGLRANWIDDLLAEISSLEPLGSTSCEGDTELLEKITIRFQR